MTFSNIFINFEFSIFSAVSMSTSKFRVITSIGVKAIPPELHASFSLYRQKVASFVELLESYQIGAGSKEGSVASAARMVGLEPPKVFKG